MNIEEAKIVMRGNIIMMQATADPGVKMQIDVLKSILNHIEKLETENIKLTSKVNAFEIKDKLPGAEK